MTPVYTTFTMNLTFDLKKIGVLQPTATEIIEAIKESINSIEPFAIHNKVEVINETKEIKVYGNR